jgi:hypothetical protein
MSSRSPEIELAPIGVEQVLRYVGDHPDIRELYEGRMRGAITSSTSVEKPELGGSRTEFRNLIISNYPLPEQPLQVAK